uniref:G-protein coupled receptors family 1 profile domain-containing protein n=1 Tax=Anabas testudineus TaxID=64144 RepID=A0A7N6ADE8_ANATE
MDGSFMNNNLNVTYITLDGYVELNRYRCLYFMIMFTAYILILCSNSTIVYLIWKHKDLHEPMYVFIAALLMNSLLFSTAIYPKLLSDVLSEKQIISYSACLFQWFTYYFLGGSEFLLLAAMSYDRYVSICKPLQYPTWLADAKICNFNFNGIICNSTVFKLHCVSSGPLNIFGLVAFVYILLLPVLFILFTYTRILIISYRSSREVRRKAAQTCLPHLLVLINFSCLSSYDVLLARIETDFPKIVRLIMTLQVILYHPLFNPIIYGVKMKEISKHLKTLFSAAKTI